MKKKLLSLAKASTEFVEKNNLQYYWEADGFKFNNGHLAKWYENTYNSWATYVAQPLPKFREVFEKNPDIDLDHNYNLDFLKKLRQENQILKLFFSGGYDSSYIFLESIENNIRFDQLISCISGYDETSIDFPENREVKNNVLPYIKKYEKEIVEHKFIVAPRENIKKLYKDPYGFFKTICYDEAPFNYRQVWSGFKNNPNDCYIRGADKPTLMYYKKSWYAVLIDSSIGSTPYENVKYFWLDAGNIKSLIKDAIIFRNHIVKHRGTPSKLSFFKPENLDDNLIINRRKLINAECQYPKQHIYKASIKDDLAMINCIENREHNLLADYYRCQRKFQEIFPQCVSGYTEYNNRGKFGWMINIDSREVFTQQELIPKGFEE